jgi:hypothetical protein
MKSCAFAARAAASTSACGRVRAAVGDVRPHRVVEEDRLLGDDPQQRAQVGEPELAQVHAVEGDRPSVGSWKRGTRSASVLFPAPLGPTSATTSPGRISRSIAAQHRLARLVLEADALEADPVAERGDGPGPRAVGHLGDGVEDLEGALPGGEPRLHLRGELAEELGRRHQLHRERQRAEEGAGGERPLLQHQVAAVPEQRQDRDGDDHLGGRREELPPALVADEAL